MEFLHNHTKNFATVHYQLRSPSLFKKASTNKMCVVSTRVVWNNINITHEWSGQKEIVNKFTYGVLPEPMDTLPTLFKIDTQIIHGFTLGTHLLNTYEVRYMFKRPITIFKVLCAFHIEENYKLLSDNLLGFSGAT